MIMIASVLMAISFLNFVEHLCQFQILLLTALQILHLACDFQLGLFSEFLGDLT
jgi:hypothetical protein